MALHYRQVVHRMDTGENNGFGYKSDIGILLTAFKRQHNITLTRCQLWLIAVFSGNDITSKALISAPRLLSHIAAENGSAKPWTTMQQASRLHSRPVCVSLSRIASLAGMSASRESVRVSTGLSCGCSGQRESVLTNQVSVLCQVLSAFELNEDDTEKSYQAARVLLGDRPAVRLLSNGMLQFYKYKADLPLEIMSDAELLASEEKFSYAALFGVSGKFADVADAPLPELSTVWCPSNLSTV